MNGMPGVDRFVSVKYMETNGERIASSVTMIPQNVAFLYLGTY